MKKIITLVIVALVFGTAMPAMAQMYAEYSEHAGPIVPSSDPLVIAPLVAAPYDGSFVQLGPFSYIILSFPGDFVAVPDGTVAADLEIDIYDAAFPADAEIYVSQDGSSWTSMGIHADTANIQLDLDGVGLVKYIKIDQADNYIDPAYPLAGFDLDGIEALNATDTATIDKSVSASTAELGDHITVTLDVVNPYDADITVEDVIPAGLAYIPGTLLVNGGAPTEDPEGDTISVTVGMGIHTIVLDVQVVEVQYEDVVVTNTANVYDPGAVLDGTDSEEITLSPYDGLSKEVVGAEIDGEPLPEDDPETDWYYVPWHTDVNWFIEITVVDVADEVASMENIVVTDNLGGDLELDEVGGLIPTGPSTKKKKDNAEVLATPVGDVTIQWSGKTEKVHLSWAAGTLPATLELEVSTDFNPGQGRKDPGVHGYTSTGEHDLNSGATLKFTDPDTTLQLSAHTGPITVEAFDPEL